MLALSVKLLVLVEPAVLALILIVKLVLLEMLENVLPVTIIGM